MINSKMEESFQAALSRIFCQFPIIIIFSVLVKVIDFREMESSNA